MGSRVAAVFVLLFQLQQFTLPALCMPMGRTATTCHDVHTLPTSAVITAAQGPASCAQASMCGAPAVALLALAVPVVAPFGAFRAEASAVAALGPSDPVAPPAPPPQA